MITTLEEAKVATAAVLTRNEVAGILRVNPRTVTEGIRQGTIPAIRVGRRIVIPREPFVAMFTRPDHAVPA